MFKAKRFGLKKTIINLRSQSTLISYSYYPKKNDFDMHMCTYNI